MQDISQFWRKISNGPRERQALTFLRMATGMFFLYAGHQKLVNPHFTHELLGILHDWMSQNPFPPYKSFVTQVVMPHSHLFSMLVTDGEIAVGFSYVLGLGISLTSILALFLNLNFLLAAQHTGASAFGINLAFILISLCLFWGQAGMHFGMDELLFTSKKRGNTGSAKLTQQSPSKAHGKKSTSPQKTTTSSHQTSRSTPAPAFSDDSEEDALDIIQEARQKAKKKHKTRFKPF